MRYISSQSYHTRLHWQSNKKSPLFTIEGAYCGSLINGLWYPVCTHKIRGFDESYGTIAIREIPNDAPVNIILNELVIYNNINYWITISDKESDVGVNTDHLRNFNGDTISFLEKNGNVLDDTVLSAKPERGGVAKLVIDSYRIYCQVGDKPDWIDNYTVLNDTTGNFISIYNDTEMYIHPYPREEDRKLKLMDIFGKSVPARQDTYGDLAIGGVAYNVGGYSPTLNGVYQIDDKWYGSGGENNWSDYEGEPNCDSFKWNMSITQGDNVALGLISENLYSNWLCKVTGITYE